MKDFIACLSKRLKSFHKKKKLLLPALKAILVINFLPYFATNLQSAHKMWERTSLSI